MFSSPPGAGATATKRVALAAQPGRVGVMPATRHALDMLADAARLAGAPALFGAREDLLLPVLRWSTWLRAFLERHPEAAAELSALPPIRTPAAWRAWLDERVPADADDLAFGRALRIARHRAMLGITARELLTGDPLATGTDLSGLASAALELALAQATRDMRARFGVPRLADGDVCSAVVIGMGKLGGNELNYSSDVDVIFAYGGDTGQTDGAHGLGQVVDLHTYHARLFARAAQLLGDVTDEGFVFRVDLDLRPEGRTGPICNSVDGLESYYESFGHAWERLAWLKARPVAGDLALGERIITALRPFVYRKHLDYGFADEVFAMKRRIDQGGARLGGKEGFNVKLGRGGIREVEFAVQTLQLTWGGRLPELRAPDTRTALSRVALAGLVDQAEADQLLGAYRFLRRIEHALQMQEDRQTHLLPADAEGRRKVAAMLGLDEGRLDATLAEHRQRVRQSFEALVASAGSARPASSEGDPAWDAALAAALEPELAVEQRDQALAELGFERAADTRLRMDAMARRPESPFHWRQATLGDDAPEGTSLAKKVVKAVLATPDPDLALAHFESLFRTLQHRRAAFDQLDADPRRLRTLAGLFGSSHALSRVIIRSPGLLERLVLDGKEPPLRSRVQLRQALDAELAAGNLGAHPNDGKDSLHAALRRFKQAETLRIGFFDLAGILDAASVRQQLSDLAAVIVQALAADAIGQPGFARPSGADAIGQPGLARPSGADAIGQPGLARPSGADAGTTGGGMSVVALGRLAAGDLGYATELDLMFVCPPAGEPALGTRAARLVVTGLTAATPEGTLYALDSVPRPSGNHGPMCVASDRLLAHHRGDAALWERQAILGARALGDGPDAALVAELRNLALGSAHGERAAAARSELAAQRARDERAAPAGDLQRGAGGVADVEFLVRLCQLTLPPEAAALARDGHDAGAVAVGQALAGLVALGLVDAARADRIREAAAFVAQLENRLALVQEQPSERLRALAMEPARWDGAEREHLRRLALRMGHGDESDPAAALQKELARHRKTLIDEIPELRS
ncbi:MAG: hypothetical protein U1F43_31615 [Myxococcota bacterium]